MSYGNADEVIEEIFESLFNRYQMKFKKSKRGSGFIFDWVHLLYY